MQNGEIKKSCIFTSGIIVANVQGALRPNPEPINLSFPCIKAQCLFYNELKQKCRFLITLDAIDTLAANLQRVRHAETKE